jgi:hypothetical protein
MGYSRKRVNKNTILLFSTEQEAFSMFFLNFWRWGKSENTKAGEFPLP